MLYQIGHRASHRNFCRTRGLFQVDGGESRHIYWINKKQWALTCSEHLLCTGSLLTHLLAVTLPVLVFWGCPNKLPPPGWLKTTGIYSLTALKARSLKSRCQRGHALSLKSLGTIWSRPLSEPLALSPSLGVALLVSAWLQSLLPPHMPSPLWVFSPTCKDWTWVVALMISS